MYELDDFIMNYTDEELGEGGVLALSEAISVNKANYLSGTEPYTFFSATFTSEKADRENAFRENTFTSKVWIDDEHSELIGCECNCFKFVDSGYSCEHVVAMQLKRLMEYTDTDTLQKSVLGDILAKKTGIDKPFTPGILKKTSRALSDIIKARQNDSVIPGLEDKLSDADDIDIAKRSSKSVRPGSLKIEIHMFRNNEKFFEIKIGSKKTYIVKDIWTFITAFRNHGRLNFGKNLSFDAYEEYLNDDAKNILELLSEVYEMSGDDKDRGYFYSQTTGGSARYIRFAGRYYDALMELLEGKEFYSENNTPLTFSKDEFRPDIKLDKMDYGALVKMDSVSKITQTEKWIYVLNDSVIYRIPKSSREKLSELMDIFEKQHELFVSEQDLPVLCRDVLAPINEVTSVSCTGMQLDKYLPIKPIVRLYLDYPQEGMISCRPEAVYTGTDDKKKEKIYSLCLEYKQKQQRDIVYEKEILKRIHPFFQSYDSASKSYYFSGDEEAIFIFLTEALPKLEETGEIYISDKLKKLKVHHVEKINVGVAIDGGLLNLNVSSDEFTKEELIELLCSYDRKKKFYRLKNGSIFKVDENQEAVFGALSECVRGLRKPTDGEWKLPLFRAMYLDEMLKDRDSVTVEKNREYKKLLSRMRDIQGGSTEPPKSLKDVLREYQTDGFSWIKTLKDNGFSGILADDMGLGKTLQVLSFILSEKEAGKTSDDMRTLIITPASLIYNWKKEIEQYTPSLKVAMIVGSASERKAIIQSNTNEAEVWITSYDLLKRDIQWYENVSFANEILDEAQFIKNQTTHAAKSVRLVQSGFRMALTGTPIENRLSELWSIFDYLMPGFLHSYTRFRDEIELPIVAGKDEYAMKRLHCLVHPFILRRMKKEVLKELPDKLEEEVSIPLEGEQRRLYDAHAQRLKMFLEKQTKEEFTHGKLEILAELTKLRQLCCHPGMIFEDYKASNAKLEACMELIHQAVDGGHKILLFSQFTTMLDVIGQRLNDEKIAFHRIDGSVKKEERMRLVESFDTDDVPIFCISLKAGGTGLNLTAADIVIHFDPWWNLAAQNQATDRTHRIGQTNIVTVYQLIAADTIEEKIVNLQKSKYKLAEDVLSGEGISSILIDQEQVLSLLN